MIEPLDYLIDMFFYYKIDMLQFMSMSACANAIKYALACWDFKLEQDYTPKDDYAPFVLTQNYWNIKARFTSKNPPTLDRINNDRGHSADNSLPMTITDEEIYQILRSGITGGLSQVMHRYNVAGETKINYLKYINGKVISQDTDHTMTHLLTLDVNCQYPSVMSSEPHKFIKYSAFDMNRMHYICGDTDSMTWAISGN
ncbi:MAG: hypothetical protein EZS28_012598, partial [Streblomastix strix]